MIIGLPPHHPRGDEMQSRLYLDIETSSELNLKTDGSYLYATHPSTRILCAAWAIDDETVQSWSASDDEPPHELMQAIHDCESWESHNAQFERHMFEYVAHPKLGWPKLPTDKMFCSQVKARYFALPPALEGAARVLKLTNQKHEIGKRLIDLISKPNKYGIFLDIESDNPEYRLQPGLVNLYSGRELFEMMIEYCKQDVETERQFSLALPDLPEYHRKTFLIDQQINDEGIRLDMEMARAAAPLVDCAIDDYNKELTEITHGACTRVTQNQRLLSYARLNGYPQDNMQGADIKMALSDCRDGLIEITPIAQRVLELRLDGAKTPLRKYAKAIDSVDDHDIMRNNIVYNGASSGRWTATGFQFQNMPRPAPGFQSEEEVAEAIAMIKAGNYNAMVERYETPTVALASLIRSLVICKNGTEFYCADYSQIEARINAWVVGDERALEMFRKGIDPYIDMAKDIYPMNVKTWEEHHSDEQGVMRDMGKRTVLGLGYRLGKYGFQAVLRKDTAKHYPIEFCERVVNAYRLKYSKIEASWEQYEEAAFRAVRFGIGREKAKVVCGARFYMAASRKARVSYLIMELASGRKVFFPNPSIRKIMLYGKPKESLCYEGKDKITGRWSVIPSHGGTFAGFNCQGLARDLMVNGLHNVVKAGYKPVLLVHDEILAERALGEGDLDEYMALMTDIPKWAEGIPVKASGWTGDRYRKG